MKTLIRAYLISLFSLWLTQNLVSGLRVLGDVKTFLISGAVLGFIQLFIKPILKILFFPINLITLGLFSWVINVGVLYLLTIFVPKVTVSPWNFSGFSYQGISISSYDFNQLLTFIIAALTLSFIMNTIAWVCK